MNHFLEYQRLKWVCVAESYRCIRCLTFSKKEKKEIDASSPKPSMTNGQLPAYQIHLLLSQHNRNINSIRTKVLCFLP